MGLFLAIRGNHGDLPGLVDAGGATEKIDFVFLEEVVEARRAFFGNIAGALDDLGPIVLEPLDLESELLGTMSHLMVEFGVLEKCLGRYATPVIASAATAFYINNGNAPAELRCADCADISGGSCSDDNEVVRCRGHK